MINGRDWTSFVRQAARGLRALGLSLAVWAPAAGLSTADSAPQSTVPLPTQSNLPAGLPQTTIAAAPAEPGPVAQLADSRALQAPGVRTSTVTADTAEPDPPALSKPDPRLTHTPLPFWVSGGPLNFGMQVAYAMQAPLPPNASHINLLYAQPRLGIVVRNLDRSPFARFQLVSEGMFGGAVHPGGRILGYTLLFELEGRTRGNTKPLVEWGGGVVNTTVNQHAYELSGHLQFTPQAGIGIEHFFSPQRAFVLEYRFLHMSDAGIEEPNHGFHSSVLTIGFRWFKRPRGAALR